MQPSAVLRVSSLTRPQRPRVKGRHRIAQRRIWRRTGRCAGFPSTQGFQHHARQTSPPALLIDRPNSLSNVSVIVCEPRPESLSSDSSERRASLHHFRDEHRLELLGEVRELTRAPSLPGQGRSGDDSP